MKSGAESGWDFSSRWVANPAETNITFIKTQNIIPVDLNAYLCGAHKQVAKFHKMLGNANETTLWWERAQLLQKSIDAVLYDETDGIWFDYDINNSTLRKNFYPSNFAPLWAEAYNTYFKQSYGARAAKYLDKQLGEDAYLGGIPTSLIHSGEQWDLPNAWPPLQEVVILGLYATEDSHAQDIALTYAKRWLESNKLGYTDTDDMFEKYDALVPGQYGGGGEYTVQSGFGWTNGVVLSLLEKFPNIIKGN